VTAAQFETLDDLEAESVLRWRLGKLIEAGYSCEAALILSAQLEVDLERAAALVRSGCPCWTAVRILL
jgi:hypothetical protein